MSKGIKNVHIKVLIQRRSVFLISRKNFQDTFDHQRFACKITKKYFWGSRTKHHSSTLEAFCSQITISAFCTIIDNKRKVFFQS